MQDQRTLGPIQVIGRYQEFGIGYIPETHTDIINWHHIGATVIEESVAKAYMLASGWNGKVSIRKATQQNEILQVVASTEDDYTKVKYELTDGDKVNAVKFMKVVMEAASDKNLDKFQQTLHARNEVSPFDPWHTTLLLKVKKLIEPDEIDLDDLAEDDNDAGTGTSEMDDLA